MSSDDEDSVTNIDFSVISNSIELGGPMVDQVINGIHYGSSEVRNLLRNECDFIIECKICRNLFRSFPNFVAHKRVYCMEMFADNRFNNKSTTSIADSTETIIVQPQAPEEATSISDDQNEPPTIDKLQDGTFKGTSTAFKLYTEVAEKMEVRKAQKQSSVVTLTPISSNPNAMNVTVTVEDNNEIDESENQTKQNDKHKSDANEQENTPSLLRKILEKPQSAANPTKINEKVSTKQNDLKKVAQELRPVQSNLGNASRSYLTELSKRGLCQIKTLKCLICKKTLSSKKSLWTHMKFLHVGVKTMYPCLFCDKKCNRFFNITKHLMTFHNKTQKEVDKLRDKLKSMSYQVEEKDNEEDRLAISNKQGKGLVSGKVPSSVVVKKTSGIKLNRCEGCNKAFWKMDTYISHTKQCKRLLPSIPLKEIQKSKSTERSSKDADSKSSPQKAKAGVTEKHAKAKSSTDETDKDFHKTSPKTNVKTTENSKRKDRLPRKSESTTPSPRFIHTRFSASKLRDSYMKTRFLEKRRAIRIQPFKRNAGSGTDSSPEKSPKPSPKKVSVTSTPTKLAGDLDSVDKKKDVHKKGTIKPSPIKVDMKYSDKDETKHKSDVRNTSADRNLSFSFEKVETRSKTKTIPEKKSDEKVDGKDKNKSTNVKNSSENINKKESISSTTRESSIHNGNENSSNESTTEHVKSMNTQKSKKSPSSLSSRESSVDRASSIKTRQSRTSTRDSSTERNSSRSSERMSSVDLSLSRQSRTSTRDSSNERNSSRSSERISTRSRHISPHYDNLKQPDKTKNKVSETEKSIEKLKVSSDESFENNSEASEEKLSKSKFPNMKVTSTKDQDVTSNKSKFRERLQSPKKHIFAIQGKVSLHEDESDSFDTENNASTEENLLEKECDESSSPHRPKENEPLTRSRRKQIIEVRKFDEVDGEKGSQNGNVHNSSKNGRTKNQQEISIDIARNRRSRVDWKEESTSNSASTKSSNIASKSSPSPRKVNLSNKSAEMAKVNEKKSTVKQDILLNLRNKVDWEKASKRGDEKEEDKTEKNKMAGKKETTAATSTSCQKGKISEALKKHHDENLTNQADQISPESLDTHKPEGVKTRNYNEYLSNKESGADRTPGMKKKHEVSKEMESSTSSGNTCIERTPGVKTRNKSEICKETDSTSVNTRNVSSDKMSVMKTRKKSETAKETDTSAEIESESVMKTRRKSEIAKQNDASTEAESGSKDKTTVVKTRRKSELSKTEIQSPTSSENSSFYKTQGMKTRQKNEIPKKDKENPDESVDALSDKTQVMKTKNKNEQSKQDTENSADSGDKFPNKTPRMKTRNKSEILSKQETHSPTDSCNKSENSQDATHKMKTRRSEASNSDVESALDSRKISSEPDHPEVGTSESDKQMECKSSITSSPMISAIQPKPHRKLWKSPLKANVVSIQEIWVKKKVGEPMEEVKVNNITVRPTATAQKRLGEKYRHPKRMYVMKSKTSATKPVCLDMTNIDSLLDRENKKCKECGIQLHSMSNLRRHIVRHLGWKRYKCKLCPFSSFNRSECNAHLVRSHKEKTIGKDINNFIKDLKKEGTEKRLQKKQETLKKKLKMESETPSTRSVTRNLGSSKSKPEATKSADTSSGNEPAQTSPKSDAPAEQKSDTKESPVTKELKGKSKQNETVVKSNCPSIEKNTNTCLECDFSFSNYQNLCRHLRNIHKYDTTSLKLRPGPRWPGANSDIELSIPSKKNTKSSTNMLDDAASVVSTKSLGSERSARKRKRVESGSASEHKQKKADIDKWNEKVASLRGRSVSLDGFSNTTSSNANQDDDLYDNLYSVSDNENDLSESIGSPTRSEDGGFMRLEPRVQTMFAALEEARATVRQRKRKYRRPSSPVKKVQRASTELPTDTKKDSDKSPQSLHQEDDSSPKEKVQKLESDNVTSTNVNPDSTKPLIQESESQTNVPVQRFDITKSTNRNTDSESLNQQRVSQLSEDIQNDNTESTIKNSDSELPIDTVMLNTNSPPSKKDIKCSDDKTSSAVTTESDTSRQQLKEKPHTGIDVTESNLPLKEKSIPTGNAEKTVNENITLSELTMESNLSSQQLGEDSSSKNVKKVLVERAASDNEDQISSQPLSEDEKEYSSTEEVKKLGDDTNTDVNTATDPCLPSSKEKETLSQENKIGDNDAESNGKQKASNEEMESSSNQDKQEPSDHSRTTNINNKNSFQLSSHEKEVLLNQEEQKLRSHNTASDEDKTLNSSQLSDQKTSSVENKGHISDTANTSNLSPSTSSKEKDCLEIGKGSQKISVVSEKEDSLSDKEKPSINVDKVEESAPYETEKDCEKMEIQQQSENEVTTVVETRIETDDNKEKELLKENKNCTVEKDNNSKLTESTAVESRIETDVNKELLQNGENCTVESNKNSQVSESEQKASVKTDCVVLSISEQKQTKECPTASGIDTQTDSKS